MAERVTQKGKRQAVPARQGGRAGTGERKKTGGQIEALEKERDQLRAQLTAAQAQIAKLEQARDEAVGRIDWALDSLHNLLESDA